MPTLSARLGGATIAYDAGAQAYSVTVGSRTATFLPANIDAAQSNSSITVYTLGTGPTTQSLTITKPGASGRFNYQYVQGAFWQSITDGTATVSGTLDAMTYGFPTADTAVQRSGRAEYVLDFLGARTHGASLVGFSGDGRAQVDLATGVLTIRGSIAYPGGSGDTFGGEATIAADRNRLTGSFSLGFDIRGQISGALYGPHGQEIGASFAGQGVSDPTSIVAGSFLGRGGAVANLPFNPAAVNVDASGLATQTNAGASSVSNSAARNLPLVANFDSASGKYTLINSDRSIVIAPGETLSFARDTDGLTGRLINSNYSDVKSFEWRETRERGSDRFVYLYNFITGNQTAAANVPTIGQAGYTLDLIGSVADSNIPGLGEIFGQGTAYIDFGTGAVSASGTTIAYNPTSGGSSLGGDFSATAQIGSGRNQFAGAFQISGFGSYTGNWAGRFFGAGAGELGASISATSGSGGVVSATLMGKQSPDLDTLPRLTELTSPRTFRANSAEMTGSNPFVNRHPLTITYDPATQSYSFNTEQYTGFNVPHIDIGPAQLDTARSTASIAVYTPALANDTATVRIFKPGGSNPVLALSYASFATITSAPKMLPDVQRTTTLSYLYGIQTPRLQMPTSGSASYAGIIAGGGSVYQNGTAASYDLGGTSRFAMDFKAATFTGSLDITGVSMADASSRQFGIFGISGSIEGNIGVGGQGSFATANGQITGANVETNSFNGAFFGPRGVEFGGVFAISQRVPGTVTNQIFLEGVTVAKTCAGSC
ncbi:transferrin-binding protein-like solute binding protein [Sphingopyxis sp. LARHCG72]